MSVAFWEMDGKIIVDGDGKPIDCDRCPCGTQASGGAANSCCTDGITIRHIYIYGYFLSPGGAYGCLPLVCRGQYVSSGMIGPFDWNAGSFVKAGSIGCVTATLTGSCVGGSAGVDGTYQLALAVNFGGGHTFSGNLNNTTNATDHGGGIITERCALDLGCSRAVAFADVSGAFLITQRNPATGIACPDGFVHPLTFTFNLTLTDAGGTPTAYSCTMTYAPLAQITAINSSCWSWNGFLDNCTETCSFIQLSWSATDSKWHLAARTHTGASDNITVYDGTAFPTAGMSTNDWKACGANANPTPMWSITP